MNIGWSIDTTYATDGSHKRLVHPHLPSYIWPFNDSDALGPVMLSKIAEHTGVHPEDL